MVYISCDGFRTELVYIFYVMGLGRNWFLFDVMGLGRNFFLFDMMGLGRNWFYLI